MTKDQLRLEFKLDLIIAALKHSGLMIEELPQLVEINKDICPLCTKPVRISTDGDEYNRHCGCDLPIRAVGMSRVMEMHSEPSTPTRSEPADGSGDL